MENKKNIKTPNSAVKTEIEASLTEVGKLIEDYYQNEDCDDDLLNKSIENLNQVRGSLELLQIIGAASLCDEMIKTLEAVLSNNVIDKESSLELVISSSFFIPKYFDYVTKNNNDEPVLLLPTINTLRKERKESIIPEHIFINFDIDDLPQWMPEGDSEPSNNIREIGKRVRHMYQVGLIGVIQSDAIDSHIKLMFRAVERMIKISGDTPFAETWFLAETLLQSINEKCLSVDTSVKHTLGIIDRQFKLIVDNGQGYLQNQAEKGVILAILYYLAKSSRNLQKIDGIVDFYGVTDVPLETDLIKERNKLDAPDRTVLKKVSGEIIECLNLIKEQLDQLDRTKTISDEDAASLRDIILKMIGTLTILDLKSAANTVKDVDDLICNTLPESEDSDHVISEIADKLISVEIAIKDYALGFVNDGDSLSKSNFNEAQNLVLKETRTNIDSIKSTIESYMDSYMDASQISDLPSLLDEVRGALSILEFKRAAEIMTACSKYVNEKIIYSQIHPRDVDIDTLTDALVGIEWYLESFENYHKKDEGLLDIASESIKSLLPE